MADSGAKRDQVRRRTQTAYNDGRCASLLGRRTRGLPPRQRPCGTCVSALLARRPRPSPVRPSSGRSRCMAMKRPGFCGGYPGPFIGGTASKQQPYPNDAARVRGHSGRSTTQTPSTRRVDHQRRRHQLSPRARARWNRSWMAGARSPPFGASWFTNTYVDVGVTVLAPGPQERVMVGS